MVHLKINGTDMSGFLIEEDYEVMTEAVYDPESEFVNIYGETVRTRTGTKITVKALVTDIGDEEAAVIRNAAESGSAQVEYSDPDVKQGEFEVTFGRIMLEKVYNGRRLWRGEISASGYIRQGL
ncbi:MAG: hypothetical protein NC078_04560 [Ruminococcus sp.]|nr:hypothetical protein [Ruminococcus sp.]